MSFSNEMPCFNFTVSLGMSFRLLLVAHRLCRYAATDNLSTSCSDTKTKKYKFFQDLDKVNKNTLIGCDLAYAITAEKHISFVTSRILYFYSTIANDRKLERPYHYGTTHLFSVDTVNRVPAFWPPSKQLQNRTIQTNHLIKFVRMLKQSKSHLLKILQKNTFLLEQNFRWPLEPNHTTEKSMLQLI